MADTIESPTEVSNLQKMKVTDLKRELKSRGCPSTGNKTELIERLQQALGTQELILDDTVTTAEILDEDDVLGGDELDGELGSEELLEEAPKPILKRKLTDAPVVAVEPAPQPKKVVLNRTISISVEERASTEPKSEALADTPAAATPVSGHKVIKLSGLSAKERLELRAQKFGVVPSVEAKKVARAERFGVSASPSNGTGSNTEVLKKRAERFGAAISSTLIKFSSVLRLPPLTTRSNTESDECGMFRTEQAEKLKARRERFNASTTNGTTTTGTLDEKKKLRAERFKIVV